MSHLDEGTLHALLDGELDLTEVKEIQAHLGGCTACGTRLRQVKEFHAEADRLVDRLEFPGQASPPAAGGGRGPSGAVPPDRPPARVPETPQGPPPILLIPDNPNWADRTRRLIAPMRWVAVLLLAVGLGYVASEMQRSDGGAGQPIDSAPLASTYRSEAPVVSPEEATPRPDSGPALGSATRQLARVESAPASARDEAPRAAPQAGRQEAPPAVAREAAGRDDEPADQAVDSAIEANDRIVKQAARTREAEPKAASDAPEPSGDLRTEAARALQELDRERQLARAAAATAAIDSARRRETAQREGQLRAAAQPAAPAPAPPQRTLEQRAGTYLRIGLDEAARQLGRPVHVIEGMSALFMGLAQGRTSPGADDTRPVVRVVYQDAQGRLILLDQQRIRPGQDTAPPGSAQPHWRMGEILLHLHGEVASEVLRNLRARVR